MLSSKTISTAGTLFFNAVIDLWVVQIFGSAKILGNTMAFTTLAAAICSFIGGYLADSSFRLRVLIMINAASSLVCGIAFLEQKQLIGKPLTVYLLVFLLNIGSYLSSPLFKTITSISVEKTRIVAFNRSITFASQLCTVLIPPAATWLFAKKDYRLGRRVAFKRIIVCFVCLVDGWFAESRWCKNGRKFERVSRNHKID